jgi:hypothetical protein
VQLLVHYTKTTILYFINLNIGDYFQPRQAIIRPIFKLTIYKIVMFDETYILFHFDIVFKHNGMSSTKMITGIGLRMSCSLAMKT